MKTRSEMLEPPKPVHGVANDSTIDKTPKPDRQGLFRPLFRQTRVVVLFILCAKVAQGSDVVVWGTNSGGFASIASQFTNIVAIATGTTNTLALRADGSVIGWDNAANTLITGPSDATNVIAIAAGARHQFALRDDGSLVAWGDNSYGQATIPAGLTNVVAIAAGAEHSLALKADGSVVAWGRNHYGQARVPAGLGNVINVAAGDTHSLALRAEGTVVVWGSTSYGLAAVPADLTNAVSIGAGANVCLALKADRSMVAWGQSSFRQTTIPAHLTNLVAFSIGRYHCLGLRSDGTVVAWGQGTSLGGEMNVPVGLTNAIAVSAGSITSRALAWAEPPNGPPLITTPSRLVATVDQHFEHRILAMNGAATYGADGLPPGLTIDATSGVIEGVPTESGVFSATLWATNAVGANSKDVSFFINAPLPVLTSPTVISAYPGMVIDYYITATNSPTGFAANGLPSWLSFEPESGLISGVAPEQAGMFPVAVLATNSSGVSATTVTFSVPEVIGHGTDAYDRLAVPPGLSNVVALATSDRASLALRSDGEITVWGDLPRSPVDLTNAVALSCGYGFAHAIRADGSLVSWGEFQPAPTVSNVAAVSSMLNNSVALLNDGSVVGWGQNAFGETTPPDGLRNVAAVSAGRNHTLGLKANGTVVAWGNNSSGQINVPTDLTNATAISAGRYHNVALRSDGTVVAWGDNQYEQAAPPPGLSNVVAVSAGRNHSLALLADGSVVHWGRTNEMPPVTNLTVVVQAGETYGLTLFGGVPDAAPPVILRRAFAVGTRGFPVYYRVLAKHGASGFAADGLPPGLTMNPDTGLVSGIAEAVGAWDATFWATNAAGVGHETARFFINDPAPSVASSRVAFAHPGVLFHYQVAVENGPADVRVSGLPPWLTFDPATGITSGLPPFDFSHYAITVTVSNQLGQDQITFPINPTTLAVFGESPYGGSSVPADAGHIVAIGTSAAAYHALAVRSNGTVLAWGRNDYGQTNVPLGLSNVLAVAAGRQHSLALKRDGTVVAWGGNVLGVTNVPRDLNNVVAIAAGYRASYALRADGVVRGWGEDYPFGGHHDIRAIAAGPDQCLALRSNGTVLATGFGASPPAGLSNVTAIAIGAFSSYALTSHGSVVRWPAISGYADGPSNPDDVVSVASGEQHSIALYQDGTIRAFDTVPGLLIATPPPGLSNVVSIACGRGFSLALVGLEPTPLRPFPSQAAVTGVNPHFDSAIVGAAPISFQWFRNDQPMDGATNASLQWPALSRTNSGVYSVVASNAFGVVTTSNAYLRMMPPTILELGPPSDPFAFRIGDPGGVAFIADDLAHFEVLGSTNLVDWPTITASLVLDGGRILVTDPTTTNVVQRFYHVKER